MASLLARLSPPSFHPERDMPDLSGRIVLVTGGNTGIGYETVKQLLLKNAKLDLADFPSVRKAVQTFLAQEPRLDLLFNNGGVMISPPEMLTAQGYDLQFGTNCIGHFFLTELLLPALLKSHAETGIRARIMHTSSIGHNLAPGKRGIEFESLKGGPERDAWVKKAGKTMGPWRIYGESKFGNILVANHFANKYGDALVSTSLHPGGIKTELGRYSGSFLNLASDILGYPAPMGAYTQLWGATVADGEAINGKYLVPWGKLGKADPRSADKMLENEVIAYLQQQVKGF
ncbi:Short-chain dehydrogenase/reductase family protein [Mycena sanguinolenta]|uniref:Short-chain dehydrogenase/reductase family protein n=1 Tax=Mycena sanguinolenta TaxID=230812 RepID=A0A8H6YTW0_9AGAR|nr:Short-chain dehydrogenase/reductase family protein [Mycena sanguinolenta]